MRLVAFTVSREIAPSVVEEMMALGCMHFVDACSDVSFFDRAYTANIMQLATTESKLDYIRDQFIALEIPLPEQEDRVELMPLGNLDAELTATMKTVKTLLDEYQQHLADLSANLTYSQVLDIVRRESASSAQNKMLRDVLSENTHLIGSSPDDEAQETDTSANLYFLACTVPDSVTPMLQRLATRATLSNCMIEVVGKISTPDLAALIGADQSPSKPASPKKAKHKAAKDQQEYDVVFVYTPGVQLQSKLGSIVTSLSGTIHISQGVQGGGAVDSVQSLDSDVSRVQQSIEDHRTLLRLSKQRITTILNQLGAQLEAYYRLILKEKEVMGVLNKLRPSLADAKILTGIAWIPEQTFSDVTQIVEACNERYKGMLPSFIKDLNALSKTRKNGTSVLINTDDLRPATVDALHHSPKEHLRQPPTYFKTGKFTKVFQNIIESYGIPSYKEINPAFFYLYQFPFTFAVMYGDIGHGIILTIVSALMVGYERRLGKVKNDMVSLIFAGRYIILLMSIFSIFTGLIYNDMFALAYDFFHSRYTFNRSSTTPNLFESTYDTTKYSSPVYAFGIDPAWRWSDNSMMFINSYKMKMAVIIGILQMIFGIVLKLLNVIYSRDIVGLLTCWIPEFLFMTCFFGYMVFCIIYKWLNEWPEGSNPPALTSLLIQMFLSPGSISPESYLFNNIPLQTNLQLALFAICIISVLWLAVAKPVYEVVQLKKAAKKGLAHGVPIFSGQAASHEAAPITSEADLAKADTDDAQTDKTNLLVSDSKDAQGRGSSRKADQDDDDEAHGVGDIVVHQVIHTIEYVLGAISHTASYLRLWALSLAHAQLSEVFYEQLFTLSYGFSVSENKWLSGVVQGVSFFVTYSAWFGVTIGVIILMEALSAFLHGLRLAWIEFNSKFYQAEGYIFEPLAPVEYTLSLEKQDE